MFKQKTKEYKQFLKDFPAYKETFLLDKLRKTEYKRLDKQHQVYLDYTGGNLYAESQLKKHLALLKERTLGNPHSTNPTSQLSTQLCDDTRSYVLNYFNATEDYICVFTSNASAALKIVGESYPFNEESFLLLSLDNHNSVNGIREFAKSKGAKYCYTPLQATDLKLNEAELINNLNLHSANKNKLFAYPAQSNVSGTKHPLKYVQLAQEKGWDVLLDVAAFVPSNKLDLSEIKPDFVSMSFYKIFGYPTGLGCLLIKKNKFRKLVKPWYAGGTISLSAATYDGHYLMPNHERFEDGTINYLDIPAIKIGLEYISRINIDTISKRIQTLINWLLVNLSELKHNNGQPLLHIFGSQDISDRGGTLVMNFYDAEGRLFPFSKIESEANKRLISIRTGCFCNPGIDETNNCITLNELESYFGTHTNGNYFEMIQFTGKMRGSVRISLGLASNFNDVLAFYKFSKSFLNIKQLFQVEKAPVSSGNFLTKPLGTEVVL